MTEIVPGEADASAEKHVPIFTVEDGMVWVSVGALGHPMTDKHHIEWISLQTKHGNQRKELGSGEKAVVTFLIDKDDKVEAVFAYCNLHGLWIKENN